MRAHGMPPIEAESQMGPAAMTAVGGVNTAQTHIFISSVSGSAGKGARICEEASWAIYRSKRQAQRSVRLPGERRTISSPIAALISPPRADHSRIL